MLSSGIICSFGVILMQKGMRGGHHGIVFTISQSAMIIPFLCGIIIFGEKITLYQLAGMIFVLISFVAFGMGQGESKRVMKNHITGYGSHLRCSRSLFLAFIKVW